MDEPALVLKGVSKSFAGHTAIKDLSLEVPRGSVFGLLGPNGAGKTTTLRMVMDILGADAGSIDILGRPADQAARELDLDYELVKVTDINEITGFGVMMTPALAVDGEVKVAGQVPSVDDVKKMLQ